jgi:hypothetical protein
MAFGYFLLVLARPFLLQVIFIRDKLGSDLSVLKIVRNNSVSI